MRKGRLGPNPHLLHAMLKQPRALTHLGARPPRPPTWLMGVWAAGIGIFAIIIFLSVSSPAPWAPKSDDEYSPRASGRVVVAQFDNLAPQGLNANDLRAFEENLRAGLAAHNVEVVAAAASDKNDDAEFVITGVFQQDAFQKDASQKDGGGAAINAQIINQAEGAVLWAGGVSNSDRDFAAAQTHALAHIIGVMSCALRFSKKRRYVARQSAGQSRPVL